MKKTSMFAAAAALVLGISAPAIAAEYTKGEITKVDEKAKKITIKHGELKNLEMPAMTMVFAVANDAMIGKAKVGQKVEFVAERVKGKITVVEMK
jgi:Cu/Ag efflux protein CusF